MLLAAKSRLLKCMLNVYISKVIDKQSESGLGYFCETDQETELGCHLSVSSYESNSRNERWIALAHSHCTLNPTFLDPSYLPIDGTRQCTTARARQSETQKARRLSGDQFMTIADRCWPKTALQTDILFESCWPRESEQNYS